MIIIICTDDEYLVKIARNSTGRNPGIFGPYYEIFKRRLPDLREDENLFIIAHGAFKGDENLPVIGDKKKAFYLHGRDLLTNLAPIFPDKYKGDIYIDACESAISTKDVLSFISSFYYTLYETLPNSKVFGIKGTSEGLIPLPTNDKWESARL